MTTEITTKFNEYTKTQLFTTRFASEALDTIPLGWWIDKSVGGCGLTYLALTDKNDCIILMPRAELVRDKMNQPDRYRNILGVISGVGVKEVEAYIKKVKSKGLPIKIVTTYDSFALGKMDFLLSDDKIGILVDECQYLAEFVSQKELKLSRALHAKLKENIERVSFFSAHPPKRQYMQEYIQKMPSVKYIWSRQIEVTPYIYDTKRPYSAVAKVLKRMVEEGSFKLNDDVIFKKAIVFVNSVSAIAEIAEAINQPYNVGYIVGDTVKNSSRLSQVATKIEDKRNLPLVTIGTSSMLAGIDLYDDETFNIVVSTTSQDWTLFDAELDIPQAITRQRNDTNPFNDKFLFIYSKDNYEAKIEALEETYEKDVKRVEIAVSNLNVLMQNNQQISDAFDKYAGYYVVEDNKAVIDLSLLNIAKYRFKELYRQYKEGFSIMANKKEVKSLKIADIKLKYNYKDYAEMISECKSKSELVEILNSIKNEEWKRYLEHGIETKKILSNVTEAANHYNDKNDYQSIILNIRNTFEIDKFYSNADVKEKLTVIYSDKSLNKKAKATDIYEFAEVKSTSKRDSGKRIEGVTIIRYK